MTGMSAPQKTIRAWPSAIHARVSLPDTLSAFFVPTLKNWAGDEIGRIAVNIATQN